MRYVPHEYQEEAIGFGVERGCCGYFLDPGLGKTSICLAVLQILQGRGFTKAMLVIAPLRVCYSVWPKEIRKWDEFKDLTVSILHGPDKDAALRRQADVYVINPEGLPWLFDHLSKMSIGSWP